MSKHTINSQDSLSLLIGKLRETFKAKRYFQVTINTGKKRGINQNFVSHGWYSKISKEEAEYTPEQVKCLCKLHLGVPILRAENEEFSADCEGMLDPLSYEMKLRVLQFFPVTSRMNTTQMKRYMEDMRNHYASRVELKFDEEI